MIATSYQYYKEWLIMCNSHELLIKFSTKPRFSLGGAYNKQKEIIVGNKTYKQFGKQRNMTCIWTLGSYGASSVTTPRLGALRSAVCIWTLGLHGANSVTDPLKK
jgi:DeoR/GlpR family transcriptional regulator of sugar metabolism